MFRILGGEAQATRRRPSVFLLLAAACTPGQNRCRGFLSRQSVKNSPNRFVPDHMRCHSSYVRASTLLLLSPMYLARIEIENFRLFGSRGDGGALELDLDPGLNLIVGENDSGKSSLVDAIRLLVGTASNDTYRITAGDFHIKDGDPARELAITGWFRALNTDEMAALFEYLSVEPNTVGLPNFYLKLCLTAQRRDPSEVLGKRSREVVVTIRAEDPVEGKIVEADARDYLRAVYLKPLRDAVQELAAKQGSRLSQVLYSHPEIRRHEESDWSPPEEADLALELSGGKKRSWVQRLSPRHFSGSWSRPSTGSSRPR